jgi:VanZ family protein
MSPRTAFRFWLPPFLWTALILSASSDAFSSAHTGPWLTTLINAIVGHQLPKSGFETLHFAIRKLAHLTEYGILGLLLFRAIRADRPVRWNLRWSLAAIAIAAVIGSLDEWHQFFVPSRTASPRDVLVDTVGATLAQILIRAAQVLFFKT